MLYPRAVTTSSARGWVQHSALDGAVVTLSKATPLGSASAVARIEEWDLYSANITQPAQRNEGHCSLPLRKAPVNGPESTDAF